MKSTSFAVIFVSCVFGTGLGNVFGAEISYPGEALRKDPVENTQSLYPGTVDAPLASGNKISVDYVPVDTITDPDSVFAGFARTGNCEKNELTFKNGYVTRYVFGGFSLKGDVKNNTVVFSGGLVGDAAIGKLCGGQTWDGDLADNFVTITGGRSVGDVYGGDADANGSAMGNRVEVRGGELGGFLNGGGVSGIGIARKNRVEISGGTVGMGVSGGFAHFAAGSPPKPDKGGEEDTDPEKRKVPTNSAVENTVRISGKAEITGNVSGGFVLDSYGAASKNTVEISGGVVRGNVYGGRAFRGEAVGNTVVISGGTITARDGSDTTVYAGYVHKPDEGGQATGNTITVFGTESDSPDLKAVTFYGNNLPTWQTDGNTLNFKGFRGTVRGFSHFQTVNIDEKSEVSVLGDGPHEVLNLNNQGRLLFGPTVKIRVRGEVENIKDAK